MAAEKWADDQAIDAWLAYIEIDRGRLVRTIETYRAALKRLQEFLAGKLLVDASAEDLQLFCGLWLHKKGVIARSRKPYISAVRGFYAWLQSIHQVAQDPGKALVHPKTGRPLPRTISLTNAEKLMWAPDMGTFIGIRDATMLSLLIGCGLRVSGLTRLNEGDLQTIELEREPRLTIRTTEKGEAERRMPVPREAAMLLQVYLGHEDLAAIDRDTTGRGGRADKVLFVSVRSTRLQAHEHIGEKRRLTRKAVNDLIKRYGKRLGIPAGELHPHAMRHLFGTELTEDDTPTLQVQDLMGHVDPKSTSIYTHLAMRKKTATMDKAAPLAKMKTPVSELLKRLPR
ncbi:tyrosine-type recombinase/integrase [Rhodoferax sp. WC2427]|uniref:tyrosine-type recombinase/integrase n=1 Tax=Rhodoferax sp. WC2427 TaxID=3234144 RepID=UPI0034679E0C